VSCCFACDRGPPRSPKSHQFPQEPNPGFLVTKDSKKHRNRNLKNKRTQVSISVGSSRVRRLGVGARLSSLYFGGAFGVLGEFIRECVIVFGVSERRVGVCEKSFLDFCLRRVFRGAIKGLGECVPYQHTA